jgi:hypothetical protein
MDKTGKKIGRRDWLGDVVLTLLGGSAAVLATVLPWASGDGSRLIDFTPVHDSGVRGVLDTQWGKPALALALVVLLAGVLMALIGPRRGVSLLGLVVALGGVGLVVVAGDAAGSLGFAYDAGLGLVLTLFVGILLVPIGVSSAAVASILARRRCTATAQPSPGSTRHC